MLCPTPAILLLAAPVREKQEPFEEPGLPGVPPFSTWLALPPLVLELSGRLALRDGR
jgi:hypothetical protein